jgi:DNA-directed RNA polymerase specialized sigma24 family protein
MDQVAQFAVNTQPPQLSKPIAGKDHFQQAVLRALQLPRLYSEIVVLCDIQNYSVTEAARMLGIAPQLATKRLRRARRMLLSTD